MTRTTKILLAIGAVCAIGCCGVVAVVGYAGMKIGKGVDLSPAGAHKTASEIADYTLPEGYSEQMGMAILGMKMALIGQGDIKTSAGTSMSIALIELPGDANGANAASDAIKDSASQQMGGRVKDAHTVDERDVTIRGESATLTISEGSGSGGATMRQATAQFTAKSGHAAMLMAMGPSESWDQAALDAFIASMK
ncbi:MAG: hypothetical protein ABI780_10790 [Ardenticatenales bacterium]